MQQNNNGYNNMTDSDLELALQQYRQRERDYRDRGDQEYDRRRELEREMDRRRERDRMRNPSCFRECMNRCNDEDY